MKKFKAHILVVDDDDRIRELVKQYLEDESIQAQQSDKIHEKPLKTTKRTKLHFAIAHD